MYGDARGAGGQDLTSATLPASTGRGGRADATTPASAAARTTSSTSCGSSTRSRKLATTARTWDELLETVVDGTRDALHADVSSLYLLDRDGAYLTLAATNGLDRFQIGRARVPFGEGVTGRRRRATARPLVIPDVKADAALPVGPRHRPAPVRRLDAQRAADAGTTRSSACSTSRPRRRAGSATPTSPSSAPSPTCSPGIVEKGRQQTEAEARVEALKAIDEARSELIALVTHELRTPLAVVRAYTDLLAEEPPLRGRESRDIERRETRAAWHGATLEQIERLDRLVDSILASVRVVPEDAASRQPGRRRGLVSEVLALAPAAARPPPGRRSAGAPRLHALADPPRLRQIVEHLVENAVKYAPPETTIAIDWTLVEGVVQLGVTRRGPGHPRRVARADLRAVRPARHAHRARLGHRPVRRQATRRIDGRAPVVRARPTARARDSSSPCPAAVAI